MTNGFLISLEMKHVQEYITQSHVSIKNKLKVIFFLNVQKIATVLNNFGTINVVTIHPALWTLVSHNICSCHNRNIIYQLKYYISYYNQYFLCVSYVL